MEAKINKQEKYAYAMLTALICGVFYLVLQSYVGMKLFDHSVFDEYSLQAVKWLSGRVSLDENISYLELAFYKGKYFISFPPIPTFIMLPFTLFFGENTPSCFVTFLCFTLSGAGSYMLASKFERSNLKSVFLGVFTVCGCNFMEYGLYSGVWQIAQAAAFVFTIWAFYLCASEKYVLGLFLIALSVGCRPLQAFQAFFLAFYVFMELNKQEKPLKILPALILPALVAIGLGVYNYVRFDNPFEFGHNYLNEFLNERPDGQFAFSYFPSHFRMIFELPHIENGRLIFGSGTSLFILNPVFILGLIGLVFAIVKREHLLNTALLFVLLLCQSTMFLCHGSMGGMQWGTRYFCDMVPAVLFIYLSCTKSKSKPLSITEIVFAVWGIYINMYGALSFSGFFN